MSDRADPAKPDWVLWLIEAERCLNGEDWRGGANTARAHLKIHLETMPPPGDFPDSDLASALRAMLACWADRVEPETRVRAGTVARGIVNELMGCLRPWRAAPGGWPHGAAAGAG